jgi:hypothetical protein
MNRFLVLAPLVTLSTFPVASAQDHPIRSPDPIRPPPTTACVSLETTETGVDQLSAHISAAQIAYITLRSEGDATSSKLRQCESVVLVGLKRLGQFKTQAAAESVVKLVLDSEMHWEFSDRSAIATHIATGPIGPQVARLLYPHRGQSLLAQEIVSCEGAKTCM